MRLIGLLGRPVRVQENQGLRPQASALSLRDRDSAPRKVSPGLPSVIVAGGSRITGGCSIDRHEKHPCTTRLQEEKVWARSKTHHAPMSVVNQGSQPVVGIVRVIRNFRVHAELCLSFSTANIHSFESTLFSPFYPERRDLVPQQNHGAPSHHANS